MPPLVLSPDCQIHQPAANGLAVAAEFRNLVLTAVAAAQSGGFEETEKALQSLLIDAEVELMRQRSRQMAA